MQLHHTFAWILPLQLWAKQKISSKSRLTKDVKQANTLEGKRWLNSTNLQVVNSPPTDGWARFQGFQGSDLVASFFSIWLVYSKRPVLFSSYKSAWGIKKNVEIKPWNEFSWWTLLTWR